MRRLQKKQKNVVCLQKSETIPLLASETQYLIIGVLIILNYLRYTAIMKWNNYIIMSAFAKNLFVLHQHPSSFSYQGSKIAYFAAFPISVQKLAVL